MHHLRHLTIIRSLRLSSFTLLLGTVSFVAFLGSIFYFLFTGQEVNYLLIGITSGIALISIIGSTIAATKCRCQLCQVAMMLPIRCSKHQNAKRFFGSYRLNLAMAVSFTGKYRCPACGELFSCKQPPADHKGSNDQQAHTPTGTSSRPVTTVRRSGNAPAKKRPRS